jgi:PAS domain S-box-containing protein
MRRRSLSARLRAAFLTLGLVAIGLTGWQAYRIADSALEDAAYARLTAIRETKKRQIETYFRFVVRTVETLAGSEPAVDALLGFEAARGDASGADARAVEALYGPTLRGYAGAFGFEDLFLVGGEPRRVLYSLSGEAPAGDALPNLVERALGRPDAAVLADFSLDAERGIAPAAFAAAAIREGSATRGVLAVRLSAREIDQVMTGGAAWRQEGLGESGETYLVGADRLMRSDSRFYLEDPEGYFEQLRARGLGSDAVERMRAAGSTVLAQPVRTEAVERAFRGEAETSRVLDYRGEPVLSSFTPLDLPGLDWVLLSEIDEEEVFRPVRQMRNRLVLLALAVSAAFLAVGYWFSRRTTRPLFALAGEIDEIRRKGLDSSVELASFQDADDEIARLAESFHELAGRLRETTVSRDYLDNLLRSMLNAVFVVGDSPEGPVIRSANHAARRLLLREADGLAGRPLSDVLGNGSSRPDWLQRLRERGELPPIEKTLVDAEGRRIPVLFTAALVWPAANGESDVVCVAQDVTALKSAEEELRVLARKLISAQEQERSRLARELHDDITQRLGVLAIDAGKLERTSSGADARGQAAALKEQAIVLSEDVQRLSRSLHPAILEDLGLPAALRVECTALSKRLDKPVSFASEDLPEWLPADARLALYRIAQECFHNITRHAGASEVNVELSVFDDRARLVIEDDGRGFAPAEARGRGGLGLASMEERARLAGGALLLESSPGRGVKVTVEIPAEGSPR